MELPANPSRAAPNLQLGRIAAATVACWRYIPSRLKPGRVFAVQMPSPISNRNKHSTRIKSPITLLATTTIKVNGNTQHRRHIILEKTDIFLQFGVQGFHQSGVPAESPW